MNIAISPLDRIQTLKSYFGEASFAGLLKQSSTRVLPSSKALGIFAGFYNSTSSDLGKYASYPFEKIGQFTDWATNPLINYPRLRKVTKSYLHATIACTVAGAFLPLFDRPAIGSPAWRANIKFGRLSV